MRRLFSALAPIGALAVAMALAGAAPAWAVPAFADQTGAPCQACHVGGFGPQLTEFGRDFKLKGYTLRAKSFDIPFSAMAVASYVKTTAAQNPPPAPGFSGNNNVALDQFSLFFASGFGSHLGAFIQTTYDGIAKAWTWDNLDVRATTTAKVGKTDLVLGVSLNNSPTVQDAWNTLPAWGYPYTSSALAPSPSASPLLNGALAQTSLGLTGYVWANDEVYLEGGGYWSPGARLLTHLGADPTSPGSIRGVAPYGRVALQRDVGQGAIEVGAFGMQTDINPGLDQSTGFADRYADLGLDASYLLSMRDGDSVSVNARYLHEHEDLKATCVLAGAAPGCADTHLSDLRADASYYWRNRIGLTVQAFDTTGPPNPVVYAANRTSRPDSSGVMLQLDGTPFGDGASPLGRRFNMRLGLQYTAYATFDGAAHDFDGLGHNASDNDTLRLFAWFAY
jgi:hypothetical protein